MDNDVKNLIERIYLYGEINILLDGCRKKLKFLEELEETYKVQCSKILFCNDTGLPAQEVYFDFPEFVKGDFKVSYSSVLCISKICKVFYLQHEFAVENLDTDRMDLVLDGFGEQAYTKNQFLFDENVVSFMQQKGYTRLKNSELEEVIPTVEMPENSIFGKQMTVENALFRDVFGLFPDKTT